MTSFSKLTKMTTAEPTVELALGIAMAADADGKPLEAVLIVASATQSNPAYLNEVLRINADKAKALAKEPALARGRRLRQRLKREDEPELTLEQQLAKAKESRDNDRDLYARTVIKGWKHVFDDTGKATPCTPENCLDFLKAIDDELFDTIRAFCMDLGNFLPVVDPSALAKN